jgi:hypothetical protein
MTGRPDPAGKPPGLFGTLRQGGGGNFTADPSFGGGGNSTFFPQRGSQDTPAPGASNAGFGFNAGPQGNQLQQLQGGMATLPFRNPHKAG